MDSLQSSTFWFPLRLCPLAFSSDVPPCLFCLLSRDDSAIVLVNHLHNTYEACSLSGCWNCVYIFYKLQGGRSAFTPHLLPHMHFILCPPCVVSPSVHHSLHRGRLECVCNRFQCIFYATSEETDGKTKCLQRVGACRESRTDRKRNGWWRFVSWENYPIHRYEN